MGKQTSNIALAVEQEIKLQINDRLYQNGYITIEMYERAKTMILKHTYTTAKEAS